MSEVRQLALRLSSAGSEYTTLSGVDYLKSQTGIQATHRMRRAFLACKGGVSMKPGAQAPGSWRCRFASPRERAKDVRNRGCRPLLRAREIDTQMSWGSRLQALRLRPLRRLERRNPTRQVRNTTKRCHCRRCALTSVSSAPCESVFQTLSCHCRAQVS